MKLESPINLQSPVRYGGSLPAEADVVVIGGGIIGMATAYELAQQGVDVVVCEKGRVGCEQSSRNWGWVRQTGRDAAELPIMMESIGLWQRLTAKSRQPNTQRTWHGGIHTASDGRVEPWTAVPALTAACVDIGVTVRENCAVRSIDETQGAVTGVTTEHGPIRANRVKRVDGGYNLALSAYHEFYPGPDAFRHLHVYRQGLLSSWSQTHFRLNAPDGFPDSWHLRRTWNAESTSPFERHRILDPQANPKLIARMLNLLRARFDGCESARATHAWAGMIDTMPDFVPVMDQADSLAGLFIATGFSGHGFGIAPGAGRVMAKLMQQQSPGHDISRFRLSRFTDGSSLVLGPH